MFRPILSTLKSKLLKIKSVLNIDETWLRVRIKIKGDGTQLGHYYKKYVWALVNKQENITYFFYDNDGDDSRGSRPIETFWEISWEAYNLMDMWFTSTWQRLILHVSLFSVGRMCVISLP